MSIAVLKGEASNFLVVEIVKSSYDFRHKHLISVNAAGMKGRHRRARERTGPVQVIEKSDYLKATCFDSLRGALVCKTRTRWRPVLGMATLLFNKMARAVILRP